jgi:hypothetical protein
VVTGGIEVTVGEVVGEVIGEVIGVTGVVVPTEVQPADRTRKKIGIYHLSLNIGVPPFVDTGVPCHLPCRYQSKLTDKQQ